MWSSRTHEENKQKKKWKQVHTAGFDLGFSFKEHQGFFYQIFFK